MKDYLEENNKSSYVIKRKILLVKPSTLTVPVLYLSYMFFNMRQPRPKEFILLIIHNGTISESM